jgi:hypothetical protein
MMVTAIAVYILLIVLSITLYKKVQGAKYIGLAVAVLSTALIAMTYGRWEYLSWQYGSAFEPIAVIEFEAASLPITTIRRADDIAQIKLFSLTKDRADLYLQDVEGNKWLMGLRRSADHSSWSAHVDGGWQIEMIHSTLGGSAQRAFFWY